MRYFICDLCLCFATIEVGFVFTKVNKKCNMEGSNKIIKDIKYIMIYWRRLVITDTLLF